MQLIFNSRDAELGQATVDLKPLGQNVFVLDGAYNQTDA